MIPLRLGRYNDEMVQVAVMTDWRDSGSWCYYASDAREGWEKFTTLKVGRFHGFALYRFSFRKDGDELVEGLNLVLHDTGRYDGRFKWSTPPRKIQIVRPDILTTLGILREVHDYVERHPYGPDYDPAWGNLTREGYARAQAGRVQADNRDSA